MYEINLTEIVRGQQTLVHLFRIDNTGLLTFITLIVWLNTAPVTELITPKTYHVWIFRRESDIIQIVIISPLFKFISCLQYNVFYI